jgi:hypothetical protein
MLLSPIGRIDVDCVFDHKEKAVPLENVMEERQSRIQEALIP